MLAARLGIPGVAHGIDNFVYLFLAHGIGAGTRVTLGGAVSF